MTPHLLLGDPWWETCTRTGQCGGHPTDPGGVVPPTPVRIFYSRPLTVFEVNCRKPTSAPTTHPAINFILVGSRSSRTTGPWPVVEDPLYQTLQRASPGVPRCQPSSTGSGGSRSTSFTSLVSRPGQPSRAEGMTVLVTSQSLLVQVRTHRKVLQSENDYDKVSVFSTRCTSRVPPLRGIMKGKWDISLDTRVSVFGEVFSHL